MSSLQQKRGKSEKGGNVTEKVVVAVKASMKEIPRTALVWALTHVVQPGDCITLLVVVPAINSGKKLWGFPRFAGDCASGQKRLGTSSEQKFDLTDSCSQMMLQLHEVYDPNKINMKIKIVSGSPCGAVAVESKRAQASWVVLDRQLKHEEKRCMEELQCNIVVMKRSQAKVLRLNLVGSPKSDAEETCPLPSELEEASENYLKDNNDPINSIRGPIVTPNSSPELGTPFTVTEAGTSSVSSSDPGTSPFFTSEVSNDLKKESLATKESQTLDVSCSDTDSENMSPPSTSLGFQPWMAELISKSHSSVKHADESSQRRRDNIHSSTANALAEKFSKLDHEVGFRRLNYRQDLEFSGNVREAVSLSRSAPPGPPPLCSICQHKAPVFGKPPRWFSYAELELATGGFSQANFLAEGGFGSVHRGVLPDGQAVAVKQHKLASSQGDLEFCSEVEVLSCAQHRNVVMLIGFCVEDKRRLLVYEYICNGSLDSHLYGRNRQPLEWAARQKVAVGAARGLRYLHEECRVGCIVHRDMRPNNILITHDFEPLVGDFGLARWQPDGDMGVDTRVIGTFGYLAPEYAQSGQITEKADVYSFGVVLVELVTGRKAVDITRPKGQQCLTEWARPLLEEYAIDELIDPSLEDSYTENEVYCMLHAASLCIRRDPHSRPRMSQVLRILEGDMIIDSNYISTPGHDSGSRSGRSWTEQHQQHHQHFSGPIMNEASEGLSGKLSHEAIKAAYWEREQARWTPSNGHL
ncbi:Inactive protein kinase [Thalictrum thalictroides]|uniref:Inactive protein kinase n=1 Tax=Thalictrum thalictroides TaxID=46969 RepID=A0A7J6X5Q4_THATH|nr:Inactive protein kinase [Thalictrum thalictroides]